LSDFVEKLKLKGQAEEDLYFARRDRDLIEALRRRKAQGPDKSVGLTIVSGGQTGVDRAALDMALAVGLPIDGWCSKGRLALDGPLPAVYPLRETPSSDYAERTEWNVRDSDATLILACGELSGGTALTARLAQRYGRPLRVRCMREEPEIDQFLAWVDEHGVRRLNLAGPREAAGGGVYAPASRFLRPLFAALAAHSRK